MEFWKSLIVYICLFSFVQKYPPKNKENNFPLLIFSSNICSLLMCHMIPLFIGGPKGLTNRKFQSLETLLSALAGVAQWIECWPVNKRVAGLIPGQGTYLGCRPSPQLGEHKRHPYVYVSLPLCLSPVSSL